MREARAMQFPIDDVRARFPSLAITDDGVSRVYLDNPAGTQVPQSVADATARAFIETNANLGGYFRTSVLAEETIERGRAAMMRLLGAASTREIVVGPSMTSLTFRIAAALAREWREGDELVLTRMDHDGNIAPWLTVAEARGMRVRWVDFDHTTWRVEASALAEVVNERTKLVAVTYASNLSGSINDIRALVEVAKRAGALTYIDAVQFAPHGFVDVAALGCDFLACSAYKFFGPHQGIVWGREELLETLRAYKVRPSSNDLPWRFELGTPPIELFAGIEAAVEYLEWLGARVSPGTVGRDAVRAAFDAAVAWERELAARLIDGIEHLDGTRIIGISDPAQYAHRVPTVSFVHERIANDTIAEALARQNIFVWSGNNYAIELVSSCGLDVDAGVVRIGAAQYNTPAEIDRTVEALNAIVGALAR